MSFSNNKFNNLVHIRDANSLVITELQSRVRPVLHKVTQPAAFARSQLCWEPEFSWPGCLTLATFPAS